jgi:peroxiredoxin
MCANSLRRTHKLSKATTLVDAFEDVCTMDAPLNERLAAFSDTLRELNFPFAEAYDDLFARLYSGDVGTTAPAVGEPMPPFMLPAHSGRLVTLEEILRLGPAVISFNQGHWCPFCKIELKTLASHHEEIAALGAQLVSILPDRQQFVRQFPEDILNNFIILTDVDNNYGLSLGLVIWLGERLAQLMEGHGYRLANIKATMAGLSRCRQLLSWELTAL